MGIRVKNLQHIVLSLRSAGTLTAAINKDVAIIPFDGYISNVAGAVSSGGTGSTATICDVNLNGTTIFGAATKVTFASTTGVASYSALSSTPTAVTAGSVLTLDVDSISLAPANVEILVTVSKGSISACTNSLDHTVVL